MIRIQQLSRGLHHEVLRGYTEAQPTEMARFALACTLEWESPTMVWVHGLLSTRAVGHGLWREFVRALADHGALFIRARRAEGHRLPRARQLPDGSWIMAVADLLARPGRGG